MLIVEWVTDAVFGLHLSMRARFQTTCDLFCDLLYDIHHSELLFENYRRNFQLLIQMAAFGMSVSVTESTVN